MGLQGTTEQQGVGLKGNLVVKSLTYYSHWRNSELGIAMLMEGCL